MLPSSANLGTDEASDLSLKPGWGVARRHHCGIHKLTHSPTLQAEQDMLRAASLRQQQNLAVGLMPDSPFSLSLRHAHIYHIHLTHIPALKPCLEREINR